MKKLLFPTLLLLSTIILLQSCQREVGFEQDQNNQVNGSFKCKIDGVQWVANKFAIAERERGVIMLAGEATDKKQLIITLQGDTVGTYQLDVVVMDHVGAYHDSLSGNPFAFSTHQGSTPAESGGTVTITQIDQANKRIKGTFAFKVFRQMDNASHQMTEGSFDLSYDNPPHQNNPTDTFRVKINGTSWTPSPVVLSAVSASWPLPIISIGATDPNTEKGIDLLMPLTVTPGSYPMDFFAFQYIGNYYPNDDPMKQQTSMSGTLQILEHNTNTKRIRGNFNFVAEELGNPAVSSNITEGYFSFKYQ